MKYPKAKATGKAGVLYVEQIVNTHGSVFRPVHQEDDFGIDGFIEIVENEIASGQLIAVQIKAGDSYLSADGQSFDIPIDWKHLEYWLSYMLPVLLICHSPSQNRGAWVCIQDHVEREKYYGREVGRTIKIPFHQPFDESSFSDLITGLAELKADERLLLRCADLCLADDPRVRRDSFQIITNHPSSRGLRITLHLARAFLLDEDIEIAKTALFTLGYGAGRKRWSWNPNNTEENALVAYATNICSGLTKVEILRAIELVDGEHFSGPEGLGERCFDVLACSEASENILYEVAADQSVPMIRRANSLYMLYACDDDWLDEVRNSEDQDSAIADVIMWLYGNAAADPENPVTVASD